MQLLQKMGWKQGEGLGKNKEGSTLPLMLDVKTDRKGLAAKDNKKKPRTLPFVNSVPLKMTLPGSTQQIASQKPPQVKTDFAGKHPVSVLNELCSKRKWRQPEYSVVLDDGPAHKKEYIFKVILNNEEYQGATSCNNKKEAKALAAQTALVKMGLLPPD